MRRLGHQLLRPFLAPLALLLTGCNAYQQDRSLEAMGLAKQVDFQAPRQTWLPEGCVQIPARIGRHMISGREPLLELRDARGARLADLNPPMPLKGLYWFTLPGVVQLGHDSWLTGIPAHPGWDVVDLHLSRSFSNPWQPPRPLVTQALLSFAEARLFHSRAFGPWKEVLRFRPDTGHGWIDTLIPLENGAFLGVARGAFRDQGHQSPLAHFTSTSQGRLAWTGLAALDASGLRPAPKAGAAREGSPLSPIDEEPHDKERFHWVARIPEGLLLAGRESLFLMDPHDGRPRKRVDICAPADRIEACQPMPDGRVMLMVCGWGRISQALERAQHSNAPSSRLLGPWILSRQFNAYGLPPMWGLIFDPVSGQLSPMPLPPSQTTDLFRARLQVTPDGKPRLLRSPGDGTW